MEVQEIVIRWQKRLTLMKLIAPSQNPLEFPIVNNLDQFFFI